MIDSRGFHAAERLLTDLGFVDFGDYTNSHKS
jgi:hypothetical protein